MLSRKKERVYAREWRKKKIAKLKAQGIEVYQHFLKTERKRDLSPKRRFRVVKRLARDKKLTLDLTLKQYFGLLSKPCYYCSKDLYGEYGVGVDRIDNSKGYIFTNLLPCCSDCNKGRNQYFTVAEFKVMVNALLKYRKQKK